jgi:small conductance mechanosensitive channel
MGSCQKMSSAISRHVAPILICCLLGLAWTPGNAQEAESNTAVVPAEATQPAAPASPHGESGGPNTAVPVDAPSDVVVLRLLPMNSEQLAKEADGWISEIQTRTSEIVDYKIAISEAAGNAARVESLQGELGTLTESRRKVFKNFELVLASWESKGGDAEAIAGHRKFVAALRADEFKATDRSTLLTTAKEWLFSKDGGIRIAWQAMIFAVSLLVIWTLAKLVSRLVRRALMRYDKFSTLLDRFLVRAVFWATMLIGILTVLSWLGVRMTPVLTLLGGASFVAAFAMQSTLSNFAAGLMIMIYRPFDVGNVVTVGGVTGKVQAMNLVSTTLLTGDNQVIVVPNSNVWGSIITNINVSDTRRVDLVFGIGYDDDEDAAARILAEVVAAHPLVLKEPEPVIKLNELADSSVNFICRPWTKTADYWTVYWDITRQVKERFDQAGISIPFPQREVHVRSEPARVAGKPGS